MMMNLTHKRETETTIANCTKDNRFCRLTHICHFIPPHTIYEFREILSKNTHPAIHYLNRVLSIEFSCSCPLLENFSFLPSRKFKCHFKLRRLCDKTLMDGKCRLNDCCCSGLNALSLYAAYSRRNLFKALAFHRFALFLCNCTARTKKKYFL